MPLLLPSATGQALSANGRDYSVRCNKPSSIAPIFQVSFSGRDTGERLFRPIRSHFGQDRARATGQIVPEKLPGIASVDRKTGRLEEAHHRGSLRAADLGEDETAGRQNRRSARGNAAIGIEPILAAIKAELGVVRRNLQSKAGKFRMSKIWRIGDDKIEIACDRVQPVAGKERRAGVDAKAFGVLPRDAERGEGQVEADTHRLRQLGEQRQQENAAAGAEIEDPQRVAAPSAPRELGQRRIDQRLAVGTRVERARIDAERSAVKFAKAEDARHGLMGKAAGEVSFEPRGGIGRERGIAIGDELLVAERGRVTEKQASIELGRFDIGGA